MGKIKIALALALMIAAPASSVRATLEPTFKLGEVYSFPNPVRPGQQPTVHVEVGMADSVSIEFVDLSGSKVGETTLTGLPQMVNDGKGAEYAYEYKWDTSSIGSGVYVAVITAHKDGFGDLQAASKIAVLK